MMFNQPSTRTLPGSGKTVQNRGRLAGGQTTVVPHVASDVFGTRPYDNVHRPNVRGGLIDKLQQADPSATTFDNPLDGVNYRPMASRPLMPPKTGFRVTNLANPLKQQIPEQMPHERGAFFGRNKVVPVIKTQGGANKTGGAPKSDTAFHPQNKLQRPQAVGNSYSADSTKTVRNTLPKSFGSDHNLWQDPTNSYVRGRPNPATGAVGVGRWETTKRSVV